jgi:DNA-binding winged helix-turn-helix (wHTH) protein
MKVPYLSEKRPQKSTVWRHGPLAIDEARREVLWQGHRLDLSPMEFTTLTYLARRAGQVVSYGELLQAVWGISPEQGGTLDQVQSIIKRLRRKLGEAPKQPRYLVNVRGVGYRFDFPSEALQAWSFRLSLPSKSIAIVELLAIAGLTLVIAWLLWEQPPLGDPRALVGYRGHSFLPPSLVPVILDGVRYEPEEFNRIQRELHSKGVYMIFMGDPQTGDFLAFSTEESCNEFAAKRGLRLCAENPPPGGSAGRVVERGNVTYVFPPDNSDSPFQEEGSDDPNV